LWALQVVEEEEGNQEASLAHLREGLSMAAASQSPQLEAMLHVSLGENARRDGDFAEAVRCYQHSFEIASAMRIHRMLGLVQLNLALTAADAGDWGRALAGAREFLLSNGSPDDPRTLVIGAMCVAAGEAAGGDAALAARWLAAFDEGRAFALDAADVPILHRGLEHCRERLGEEFDVAYAQGLGLPPVTLLREVRDWLEEQAPGVASPDRPAGLSPREVEILRLVAGGESNQAIADRLVLSRRTVENHIANVYAKIGANNRVEATRFAMEHSLAVSPVA
jgi:DNA-binding CsgD family transcriptional regulator